MRYFILFLIFIVEVGYGQMTAKRQLTPDDYRKWSSFEQCTMSKDGQWVSYGLKWEQTDTLYLQSTVTKERLQFAGARWNSFSPKSDWFSYYQNDSLRLYDLKRKKELFVSSGVVDYGFVTSSNYLYYVTTNAGTKVLHLRNMKSGSATRISSVESYQFSPDQSKIAYVTRANGRSTVALLQVGSSAPIVLIKGKEESTFKDYKWDGASDVLSFFEYDTVPSHYPKRLYWCTGFESTVIVKQLEATFEGIPSGYKMTYNYLYLPEVKGKVLLSLEALPSPSELDKKAVQIWKSTDLTVPPKAYKKNKGRSLFWYSWDVHQNSLLAVADSEHDNAILTSDTQYALVSNNDELAPLYKSSGEIIAYYVKELATGKKTLLSDKQKAFENQVMLSPKGNRIAYFRDGEWWVYDIVKQQHRCLTKGMEVSFERKDYDQTDLVPPASSPFWLTDGSGLVIGDHYDLWLVTIDGQTKRRLTNGAKTKTIYRIHESLLTSAPNPSYYGLSTKVVDMSKPLLLTIESEATLSHGISVLEPNGKINTLINRERTIHVVKASEDLNHFLILEFDFALPPRLLYVSSKGKEAVVCQSNPQQAEFKWGKSKLITYQNKDGKLLKGALFYPDDYDAQKEYPLLVSIYEKKSGEVFDYTTPSQENYNGFNVTNFVTNGYFVLYPDITYGVNTPGDDALDCVTAAVTSVLKDYPIAKQSIGLIGHSFGGYETSYIMTQSSLFKTAVIGAPSVDLTSGYLTMDGHGVSNMWRYEFGQYRTTAPFYETKFYRNSPLMHVQNVTSPVLIWTGTEDLQLDWLHSVKLYNALWRLGKKSTLLVYPGEGHVFGDTKHQQDLTEKIEDWFDYYLKGKPNAEWMEE